MQELFHVTPLANLNLIATNGLLPQVGERSAKLNEKPGVFLFPTYEDCETALMGWLGDEFDDAVKLVTLKIRLLDNFPLEKPTEWERVSRIPIQPKHISLFKYEG